MIIFFLFENISLKKYQYTWLNSFAKFTNIQKNFEIDYLGISNKNIQKHIIIHAKKNNLNKDISIPSKILKDILIIIIGFISFNEYKKAKSIKIRPLIAYQNVRNIKRSNPNDCKLIPYYKDIYNDDIVVQYKPGGGGFLSCAAYISSFFILFKNRFINFACYMFFHFLFLFLF